MKLFSYLAVAASPCFRCAARRVSSLGTGPPLAAALPATSRAMARSFRPRTPNRQRLPWSAPACCWPPARRGVVQ